MLKHSNFDWHKSEDISCSPRSDFKYKSTLLWLKYWLHLFTSPNFYPPKEETLFIDGPHSKTLNPTLFFSFQNLVTKIWIVSYKRKILVSGIIQLRIQTMRWQSLNQKPKQNWWSFRYRYIVDHEDPQYTFPFDRAKLLLSEPTSYERTTNT